MKLKNPLARLFDDALPESVRRKEIEERQQTSVTWWFIHHLGSLKLAMTLLAVLIIACIVGTVYETDFNAKVARHYVYDAPWFIFWLFMLAINLFTVMLTRWPWRSKHLGFIVTHIGIIILLIGSIIGKVWGYEGTFTLQKGEKPSSRIIIDRSVLLVESPASGDIFSTPIQVETKNAISKPLSFPLPDTKTKLIVEKHAQHLIESNKLVTESSKAPSGIEIELKSPMVAEPIVVPLLLDDATNSTYDFFGMGKIFYQSSDLEIKPEQESFHESQMVLANHPELSLKVNEHSHYSGYQATLEMKDKVPVLTMTSPQGEKKTFKVADVLKKEQKAFNNLAFEVTDYWPDLLMENGQPRSQSNNPNNPAILVHMSGTIAGHTKPSILLKPVGTDKIQFKLYQDGKVTADSQISINQLTSTGLGPWQLTVKRIESNAKIEQDVQTVDAPPSPSTPSVPGLLVHLFKDNETGPSVWIPSGTSRNISVGKEVVRIGFGLETKLIPVAVSLLNFEVPFDEGTKTPANFKASVRFDDIKTQATGNALIEMNTPAIFPNETWRAWTGFTYKFSQAGWNPENPNESTLQVLFDPGWLPKWVGSLMICIGIGIMFYYKPYASRKE